MFAVPFTRSRAASAFLIALAIASGAKASPRPPSRDMPSRVVRYGDLDLATEAGADMLRLRAHRAIADMYDAAPSEDIAEEASIQQAKRSALMRADAQVAAVVDRVRAGAAS